MRVDSGKGVPGLHSGMYDLIRVLAKQAHCSSRTIIVCEPSCMNSYVENKYHEGCMPPKGPRLRETCRPVSLWNPIPTETFNYDCFFYRRYPERDAEYREIDENYRDIKRQMIDYSPVGSRKEAAEPVGGSNAESGGKRLVDRTTAVSGRRAVLDNSTGSGTFTALAHQPAHIKRQGSDENVVGESGFEGSASSVCESVTRYELEAIEELEEESDQVTTRKSQSMQIAFDGEELSTGYTTAYDSEGPSMRDVVKSTVEEDESEIETDFSSTDVSLMTWVDSTVRNFDVDSSPALLLMVPEDHQDRETSPCTDGDTSQSKPPFSHKFDNSSRAGRGPSIPWELKTGKPYRSLDQEGVAPLPGSRRSSVSIPLGSAVEKARLSLPGAFELVSQIADVIVLETCVELCKKGLIPTQIGTRQVPKLSRHVDKRTIPQPSDDSTPSPSYSKAGHNALQEMFDNEPSLEILSQALLEHLEESSGDVDFDAEIQPAYPHEESRESSAPDLNEGSSLKLNAPPQEAKHKVGKYALLFVPILALLAGAMYTLFRHNI